MGDLKLDALAADHGPIFAPAYPSGLTGVDLFGRPVPGHEFFEAGHFLVCDAGKNPA